MATLATSDERERNLSRRARDCALPFVFLSLIRPRSRVKFSVRMTGFRRPLMEMSAVTPIGATLMILADWLGRVLLFPNRLPAGLIATLIAVTYLSC
ncbi:iron chelate uptake ABC transporter family permease subunit [Rhizobium sp. A22-96]